MTKRWPIFLTVVFLVFLIVPPLFYISVAEPMANRGQSLEWLEYLGFFGGLLLVLLAVPIGLVASALWLHYNRRQVQRGESLPRITP